MMYKALPALLILSAACLQSSCYTNYNQYWMKNHRDYKGYEVRNYSTVKKEAAPSVWRVEEEWYLEAQRMDFQVRRRGNAHHWKSNWWAEHDYRAERDTQFTAFHKISPEMAHKLINGVRVDDAALEKDLRHAGGTWRTELPRGRAAQPHPIKQKYSWSGVDTVHTHAPWYNYAAMGLTFVCVDIPCTAALSSLELIYRPIDTLLSSAVYAYYKP